MTKIRNLLYWILTIVLTPVITSLLVLIVYNLPPERKIFYSNLLIQFFPYLLFIFIVITVIVIYDRILELKKRFGDIWEYYQKVSKITPDVFKIQKFHKAYIFRESDNTFKSLLENGKHAIIIGKPKLGKTRLTYEKIKEMEKFFLIKPKKEKIETEKIKIPYFRKKNIILYLDDLNEFVGHNIDDLIQKVKKKSKKIIIVATCRTGDELDLVKNKMPDLYRTFTSVKLEEIDEEKGKKLANEIGLTWKPTQFDKTPGSVILDLQDMKNRYDKMIDEKIVLKSLKLLNSSNNLLYKEERVKDICRYIFGFPEEKLKRYYWDEIINNLIKNEFIDKEKNIFYVYTPYLEFCVHDFFPSEKDLIMFKNLLIRKNDSGGLFFLGIGFFNKNDLINAKVCIIESIKLYPKYVTARNNLGFILSKIGESEESRGKYDKAEKLYEEAKEQHEEIININPYYAPAHSSLGYVLTRIGEIKEYFGKHDEANQLFLRALKEQKEAIKLNKNFISAHYCLGYILKIIGNIDEAIKEYHIAIDLDPNSPYPYNHLGFILAEHKKNNEAERMYRKAIQLDPNYTSAHNNLGHLLTKLKRYGEAEKEYKESLRTNPNYIVAYRNLGLLNSNLGRYEEAEKYYKNALTINEDYAEVHCSLGYIYFQMKKYNDAEDEYKKAILLKPSYVEAHNNLGYLFQFKGDEELHNGRFDEVKRFYQEVEKEYKKSLEINPKDLDALIGLGLIFERINRDDEAEKYYTKAVHLYPDNIKTHMTFAYFLKNRGREPEAEKHLTEVVKINPFDLKDKILLNNSPKEFANFISNRVRILIKLGRLEEAEKDLTEAINSAPDNALTYKTLGLLKEELGDKENNDKNKMRYYQDAIKAYKKAIELNNKYPSARRHLANVLIKTGRYEEAENEFIFVSNITKNNYPKNIRDYGFFLIKKDEGKKQLELALKLFRIKNNKKEIFKIDTFLRTLL